MAYVIGLTGGIASGKTTSSNILRELGAIIVDADEIARRVVEKGRPALNEIKKYFGQEIILENGQLNRKKLGHIVFNDEEALKKLNEITHPHIIKKITDEINWHKKTSPNCVIILDAPLLIEQNLTYLVDEVWLVVVPEKIQLNRLIKRECRIRECISAKEAQKRIDAQILLEHKKKYADRIIDNSGDLYTLRKQVEENWNKIIGHI